MYFFPAACRRKRNRESGEIAGLEYPLVIVNVFFFTIDVPTADVLNVDIVRATAIASVATVVKGIVAFSPLVTVVNVGTNVVAVPFSAFSGVGAAASILACCFIVATSLTASPKPSFSLLRLFCGQQALT